MKAPGKQVGIMNGEGGSPGEPSAVGSVLEDGQEVVKEGRVI